MAQGSPMSHPTCLHSIRLEAVRRRRLVGRHWTAARHSTMSQHWLVDRHSVMRWRLTKSRH
jgi:hypothetical protein